MSLLSDYANALSELLAIIFLCTRDYDVRFFLDFLGIDFHAIDFLSDSLTVDCKCLYLAITRLDRHRRVAGISDFAGVRPAALGKRITAWPTGQAFLLQLLLLSNASLHAKLVDHITLAYQDTYY